MHSFFRWCIITPSSIVVMWLQSQGYPPWQIKKEFKMALNPILPRLWKDVVTRGGAIMAPPWFFGFGATKSPKLNLGTFLGLKTTWEAILNIFRSLCLVARGRQISIDITVGKFKIFKISSFKGVMHLKWKLRTCTIHIELEKVGFIRKKTKI